MGAIEKRCTHSRGTLCCYYIYRTNYHKEYVASLIGLYKNNGAVFCDGNYFPLIQQLYRVISHGVTCNLIPNCMESCYGQISIDTATYSFDLVCINLDAYRL